MKKLNLLKLSFCAMLFAVTAAFTSCVDDNDDLGMPYLEVTPETLSFDADGRATGDGEFIVRSNRPWTLTIEEGQDWVRPSVSEGSGDGVVSFNLPASQIGQRAAVTFSLKNNYAVYKSQTVYVQQGEVIVPDLIYKETFGVSTDPWPEASAYTGWVKSGSGASTVSYAAPATGVTVRTNQLSSENSSTSYVGSGGANIMFGNAATYLTVQTITLPADATGYTLSFGASFYQAPDIAIFSALTVRLSGDGVIWTDPLPYGFKGFTAGKSWNLALVNFSLKQASEKLYVKFESTKPASGNYRIDDVTLMTGNGGMLVDLATGAIDVPLEVTTEAAAHITATGATLNGSVNVTAGVTAVGFQYIENSDNINWANATKVTVDPIVRAFSKGITGLADGKTYAVRAYATTADGDVLGGVVTFIAKDIEYTQTNIPALIAKMVATTATPVDDNYTFSGVICSDPTGGNFSPESLYVMTKEATTAGNAVLIYGGENFDITKYAMGDEVQVNLPKEYAKMYKRFGVPQIESISDFDLTVKTHGNAVTPITVTPAQLVAFAAMPVRVENVVAASAGPWMSSAANTTVNFTVGGATLPLFFSYNAFETFGNKLYKAATGTLTGLASVNNNVGQVLPRNLADVAVFTNTAPTVTTGASSALAETTVTLAGSLANITGATEVGVKYTLYAENIDWSIITTKVAAAAAAASWSVDVTALQASTKYSYAAYAVTAAQTYYGESLSFTTEGTPADIITDFGDLTNYPAGFPTAKVLPEASFIFGGQTYTFKGTADGGYYRPNSTPPYVIWGKLDAFIEIPAIAGKSLSRIRCTVPKDAANNVQVGIYNAAGTIVAGGGPMAWPTVMENGVSVDRTYIYDLSETAVNTRYRMVVKTTQNAQLRKLELWYRDGGSAAEPAMSASLTTMEFAKEADATGLLSTLTIENQGALTLFVKSSDAAQFPATIVDEAGVKKVKVTALANATTDVKNATVTAYLADSEAGVHKAEATIAVKQFAQPSGTEKTIAELVTYAKSLTPNSAGVLMTDWVDKKIVGYIAANNAYGNLANFIAVVDNTGAAGSGVLLYGTAYNTAASYPVGAKVTLTVTATSMAKTFNQMLQLVDLTTVADNTSPATMAPPTITIDEFNTNNYLGMAVKITGLKYAETTSTTWVPVGSSSATSQNFTDVAAKTLVTRTAGSATWRNELISTTVTNGTITGVAQSFNGGAQIFATTPADVAEFKSTAPTIIDFSPSSIEFPAAGASEDVTLVTANQNGNAVTAAGLTAPFSSSVSSDGLKVTVTAPANAGAAIATQTLTISLANGNSVTVAVRQKGAGEVDTKGTFTSMAPFLFANGVNVSNSYSQSLAVNGGAAIEGLKLGTSSKGGVFTSGAIGVSGDKKLSLYAAAWKAEKITVYIRVNGGGAVSGAANTTEVPGNEGLSGSGTFTVTLEPSDYYTFNLTGLTEASTITFSTNAGFAGDAPKARGIVCGVQLY